MRHWTRFATVIAVGLSSIFLILTLPILFGGRSSPLCSVAQAQDNPCLAQEATISAMRLQVIDLQATNTALESTLAANVPNPTSFLREDFDTNARGWDLVRDTGIGFIDGNLELTVPENQSFALVVPEYALDAEFYTEVEVEVSNFVYSGVGFWIGNSQTNQLHRFMILGDKTVFFDNFSALVETSTGLSTVGRARFVLSLELYDGEFTMYADGNPILSYDNITPYGSELLLVGESTAISNVITLGVTQLPDFVGTRLASSAQFLLSSA